MELKTLWICIQKTNQTKVQMLEEIAEKEDIAFVTLTDSLKPEAPRWRGKNEKLHTQ